MQTQDLINANEFCIHHNIEISFIQSLQEAGLVEISVIEESYFVDINELQRLEKLVHFYYDLGINIEGIETISHLLQRINNMEAEINRLKNKLSFYD